MTTIASASARVSVVVAGAGAVPVPVSLVALWWTDQVLVTVAVAAIGRVVLIDRSLASGSTIASGVIAVVASVLFAALGRLAVAQRDIRLRVCQEFASTDRAR